MRPKDPRHSTTTAPTPRLPPTKPRANRPTRRTTAATTIALRAAPGAARETFAVLPTALATGAGRRACGMTAPRRVAIGVATAIGPHRAISATIVVVRAGLDRPS